MNTVQKGSVRCMVFKDGNTWYAVALEFNIVEEGDNPTELMSSIIEAAQGHLEVVRKLNLPDDLLNRHAPKGYWDRYYKAVGEIKKNKRVTSPYNFLVFPYAARTF